MTVHVVSAPHVGCHDWVKRGENCTELAARRKPMFDIMVTDGVTRLLGVLGLHLVYPNERSDRTAPLLQGCRLGPLHRDMDNTSRWADYN